MAEETDVPAGTLRDELDAAYGLLAGVAAELVDRLQRDDEDSAGDVSAATEAGGMVGTGVLVLIAAAGQDERKLGGRSGRLADLLSVMAAWSEKNIEPEDD